MPSPPNAPRLSGSGDRPREPLLATALLELDHVEHRAELRDRIHQRLLAWAQPVRARLRALGHDAASGARAGRVFSGVLLVQGGPMQRGCIALSLRPDGLEVAVQLPAAEAPSVRARVADPVRALELTTALQALPEQFEMGVGEVSTAATSAACRASTDQLRGLLERVESEQRPLWLGWVVPREVAVAHAADLDEQFEGATLALASVFAILLPVHDRHAAPGATGKSSKRNRHDDSRGDEERSRAKSRARHRRDAEDAGAESDLYRLEPDAEADASESAKSAARPGIAHRETRALLKSRSAGQRGGGAVARSSGRQPGVDKGSRVRVLEGPFAGRVGVIQELDGKGGARVMLGLLAVRVDVRDLARSSEERSRPVLSTSHRKPLPVRS